MIVELSLLAPTPAALVGIYHGFQLLRPKWGRGADQWKVILAIGTVAQRLRRPALGLGVVAFATVGLGPGAAATNLLALLAAHVAPGRKTAASSLVWILMIAGLAASGTTIRRVLAPYSSTRLVQASIAVAVISLTVTVLALWGRERAAQSSPANRPKTAFRALAREVWHDDTARAFVVFVFVAVLAYNTQDLILDSFGGHAFGMMPGASTALGGKPHTGALIGMLTVFLTGMILQRAWITRAFMLGGCIGSRPALIALALGGQSRSDWPFASNVLALGFCNGVFAASAIGMMMRLASDGHPAREGTRIGVFGAAQFMGIARGAWYGAGALDGFRALTGLTPESYSAVFIIKLPFS